MKIIVGILIAVLIVGGVYYYSQNQKQEQQETEQAMQKETNMEEESVSPDVATAITLDEIAKHSVAEDCWLAIEGKVFNVTEYIAGAEHPGGEAILQGCGKDATILFNTRPMGSGTSHSEEARSFSENFIIGDLAQ